MKVGIKTFTDKEGYDYMSKVIDHCDFIEILVVPDDEIWKQFRDYDIPITIHVAHQRFGSNPAMPGSEKRSHQCTQMAIDAADYFGSKDIVVHPGNMTIHENRPLDLDIKDGDKRAIDFLKRYNEPRFRIENLPTMGKKAELGTYPKEIRKFMKELKCGFCFDFSHAVLSCPWIGIGYREIVNEFMKLKPKYFHICGGSINGQYDHQDLGKGDFDVDFFKSLLPKDAKVILETPPNAKTHIEDIRYIKS